MAGKGVRKMVAGVGWVVTSSGNSNVSSLFTYVILQVHFARTNRGFLLPVLNQ